MTGRDERCTVDSCRRPVVAVGLCAGHDNRMRRTGDIQPDRPLPGHPDRWPPIDGRCRIPGCTRTDLMGRGCCGAHYRRWWADGDVRADQPIRPHMAPGPILDVDHGNSGYVAGCRCDVCRDGSYRYMKQLRHGHRRLVDAAPVADHLEQLVGRGLSIYRIARLSGAGETTLRKIAGRQVATVRRPTAARILAVPLPCVTCDEPALDGGRWCLTCLRHHAPTRRAA